MDFKSIVNILFYNKKDWHIVSDIDKENLYFIINRYLAKKYPKKAQFFNKKNIDKATAMDIWFFQLKNENKVPYWFWSGPTKRKEPNIKDWKVIQEFWDISLENIYALCDMFPDEVKAEIKRINLINEEINR